MRPAHTKTRASPRYPVTECSPENNAIQHETTQVKHDTSKTRLQHDATWVQHDITRPQHDPARPHPAPPATELYHQPNIVPHAILPQPLEYQGLIIFPLNITPCAKLSGLLYIKFKIAVQVPKTYIYPLFRALSTITMASLNEPLANKWKSRIKIEKMFIILKCISNSFLLA